MRVSRVGSLAITMVAAWCVAPATGQAATSKLSASARQTLEKAGIDTSLLTRAPVQLHPLATAPANPLGDNIVKLLVGDTIPTTGGEDKIGSFSMPVAEPTIDGKATGAKCISEPTPNHGFTTTGDDNGLVCKPAAGTLVSLPDGRILYWDALEGTENNKFSIVGEGGVTFTNDSARILTGIEGSDPKWTNPTPYDGGANPKGTDNEGLIPGLSTTETYNDGALFGSHESFLPDGKLLVQGGTDYSLDPGVDGVPFGAVELTGLKATRIFDPKTNTFTQTGDTNYRRWYPTLVETGNGKYFDFSGVGKLLKPVYPDHPQDSLTNVKQVESYDPGTGKWTLEPSSANYDLPLYPRMSLLPDGHIFYNGDGQDFNPFGQSIGELNWENLASFDPATHQWSNLGLANTATPLAPGFRGSTSSTLLPLEPNADGSYTKARYLTAGGVLLPSPGSYLATDQSSITTIDTAGGKDKATQKATGPLPQTRWFGQNVQLPTGQVMVFSGANADEVVGPGTEVARQQADMFDPATNTWTPMAVAHNPRTYHNTAVLLPSGAILVGGHATISTLYLNNTTLPGGFAPHDGRDPSFEIYKPPYLYNPASRPTIARTASSISPGETFGIRLGAGQDASDIASVALVRHTAITHIVDADQRTVMLPVLSRKGNLLLVKAPSNVNVAPAGPYMVFVNKKTDKGLVPSVAAETSVKGSAR